MLVKYSISPINNTVKTNSIVLSTGGSDYGPTASTGFWNGITPPSSGYTIYTISESRQEPSIVCAANDDQAIYFAKSFGGTNISTIQDALAFLITGSTGTTIVNMDYPSIVTSGLGLNIDGGFVPSYPRKGNIINDISGNNLNCTLINNPSYDSSNGGCLKFNGINSYLNFSTHVSFNEYVWTASAWFKTTNTGAIGLPIQNGIFTQLEDSSMSAIGVDNSMIKMTYFDYVTPAWTTLPTGTTLNVSDGNWHNITTLLQTFGYNPPGIWTVYIDNTKIIDNLSVKGLGPIFLDGIGNSRYGGGFDGYISNVQIYSRLLSPTEITQNYNALKGRFGL